MDCKEKRRGIFFLGAKTRLEETSHTKGRKIDNEGGEGKEERSKIDNGGVDGWKGKTD